MNNFQLYFSLGWQHIVSWHSLDHILFLTVLILIFNFKDWHKLLALVSLFTLAHSVSLFLSIYGILKINSNLIELLILWTILITAISNIFIKNNHLLTKIHYYFSFIFGFIHGLGFAKDFKIIIANNSHKLIPLLEFALGIEVAQIILGSIILLTLIILPKFISLSIKETRLIISSGIIGYILALIF